MFLLDKARHRRRQKMKETAEVGGRAGGELLKRLQALIYAPALPAPQTCSYSLGISVSSHRCFGEDLPDLIPTFTLQSRLLSSTLHHKDKNGALKTYTDELCRSCPSEQGGKLPFRHIAWAFGC